MNRIYLFMALIALCACEKMQIEEVNNFADFYCSGEVKYTMHEDFKAFAYRLGDTLSAGYLNTFHTIMAYSSINGGRTYSSPQDTPFTTILQASFAGTDLIDLRYRPFLAFEFSLSGLAPNQAPSKEMLDAYFYSGRHFPFGRGENHVNVLLNLPLENPLTLLSARASFLYEPEGNMVITGVEDYEAEYYTPYNPQAPVRVLRGKRISCTFEGSIARYDREEHQGSIEDFRTDEALPLRNGEAVFFVAYE